MWVSCFQFSHIHFEFHFTFPWHFWTGLKYPCWHKREARTEQNPQCVLIACQDAHSFYTTITSIYLHHHRLEFECNSAAGTRCDRELYKVARRNVGGQRKWGERRDCVEWERGMRRSWHWMSADNKSSREGKSGFLSASSVVEILAPTSTEKLWNEIIRNAICEASLSSQASSTLNSKLRSNFIISLRCGKSSSISLMEEYEAGWEFKSSGKNMNFTTWQVSSVTVLKIFHNQPQISTTRWRRKSKFLSFELLCAVVG